MCESFERAGALAALISRQAFRLSPSSGSRKSGSIALRLTDPDEVVRTIVERYADNPLVGFGDHLML